ncbi:MAG: NAD(P)-dependent dehydrogenase (short-subunit alcohol dehydrogenase family) [Luteibaculaceae bacterium]|jgi:NAD(P)-dependent dehydrogenase (short-subunit alcohol dehydrogenase family)
MNLMLKSNTYENKIVWITGGGSGLGKKMAEGFLRLGAQVFISGRRQEKLEATVAEFAEKGLPKCHSYPLDVRKAEDIEKLILFWEEQKQIPDVLVNNAAGNFIAPTETLSHKAFDVVIDIVLKGSTYCSLYIGKAWIKNKIKGAILNITTTYAASGSGFVVPSACAKAGVSNLTKSLGSEWGKYGIRVNAIAPGPIPTKGAWERLFPGDLAKKFDLRDSNPLGRFGEPEELANLATYLCSDYAGYTNGEIVTMDGGELPRNSGEFNFLEKLTQKDWLDIKNHVQAQKQAAAKKG